MKKRSYIVLLPAVLMLAGIPARAQVCSGPVTLTTQAEVNAFACSEVTNDVTIQGNDITELSSLSTLTSVDGSLIIFDNVVLASLLGLDNLTSIGNALFIQGNPALTSLLGLDNLASIGGFLSIAHNAGLMSLTGLENLASVGGFLGLYNNDALASLAGLEHLTSVGDYLFIVDNNALTACSCGLAGLVTGGAFSGVAGVIIISNNAPGGTCNAPAEVLATPCTVEQVNQIAGSVKGLVADGTLTPDQAGGLLTKLYAIKPKLRSGQIRSAVNQLGAFINQVQAFCPSKLDCSSGGDGGLLIAMAEALIADLQTGATARMARGAGSVTLNESTLPLPRDYGLLGNYPNPFNPATTIQFVLPEAGYVRLVVNDLLGREVARLVDGAMEVGRHSVRFDAGHLASGVYLYRIDAGPFTAVRRMLLVK